MSLLLYDSVLPVVMTIIHLLSQFGPLLYAKNHSTRLLKSPTDIYYSFVSADFVHSTQPLKLTTWHPEQSAYKILSIPPPPSDLLQSSREWRIMLSCPHPKAGTEPAQLNKCGFVSLDDDEIGVVPFPVFSLPIRLETAGPSVSGAPSQKTGGRPSKGKGKSVGSTKVQKQEGVQRVLVMEQPLLRNEYIQEHTDSEESDKRAKQHRILISEKTSFDLDKVRWTLPCAIRDKDVEALQKIWDSGLGLSAWLTRKLASHKSITDKEWNIPVDPVYRVIAKLSQSRCRILELGEWKLQYPWVILVHSLGTGSGLVSLILACVLSSQSTGVSLESTLGPSILATDLREFVT